MTMPKRGTRKLVVDGREFAWHLSPGDADELGTAPATVAAAEGSGVLHYWPAEGFPSPREAAEVVRFALTAGWEPLPHAPTIWVGKTDGEYFLSPERLSAPRWGG